MRGGGRPPPRRCRSRSGPNTIVPHNHRHPALELFFQLVSSGYGRASLIVTSNKTVRPLGEVFGDDVVATAMIDRLVHHAEVAAL